MEECKRNFLMPKACLSPRYQLQKQWALLLPSIFYPPPRGSYPGHWSPECLWSVTGLTAITRRCLFKGTFSRCENCYIKCCFLSLNLQTSLWNEILSFSTQYELTSLFPPSQQIYLLSTSLRTKNSVDQSIWNDSSDEESLVRETTLGPETVFCSLSKPRCKFKTRSLLAGLNCQRWGSVSGVSVNRFWPGHCPPAFIEFAWCKALRIDHMAVSNHQWPHPTAHGSWVVCCGILSLDQFLFGWPCSRICA